MTTEEELRAELAAARELLREGVTDSAEHLTDAEVIAAFKAWTKKERAFLKDAATAPPAPATAEALAKALRRALSVVRVDARHDTGDDQLQLILAQGERALD